MPEKRRNQVHVYLSDEEVGMLSHLAASCGLTASDALRQALRSAYQVRLGVEVAKRAQSKPNSEHSIGECLDVIACTRHGDGNRRFSTKGRR